MKSFFKNILKNIGNSENKSDFNNGKSPLFFKLAIGGTGVFFFLITFLLLIIILFGPIMLAGEYLNAVNNGVSNFFEKVGNLVTLKGWCTDEECNKPSDQKYNEKLNEVYSSYKQDGVIIDTDLITGTIYYGTSFSDKFDEDDSVDSDELVDDSNIHLSDIKLLASNMVSGKSIDYSKYRNYLLNTYVPKRFSDMYNSDKEKERIVDEIMMYASGKVDIAGGTELNSVYEECSQVCSTTGECYDLEEFVVRVVDHESGGFIILTSNYAEEWKAQAVAARTATLYMTNSCTKPIVLSSSTILALDPSSTRSQHDKIADAIKETQGQILTIDGKPITASWDSFYRGNDYHCDDNLCYSTYTKIGSTWEGSTHEIASYKKWNSYFLGGHGHGLSQYGAAYLADIGWNYKDILKYYYDDRAVLSEMTGFTGSIVGGKFSSNPPEHLDSSWLRNVNYNYYVGTNYGQCVWFARGRAAEIIANSNMPDDIKSKSLSAIVSARGDGRQWYSLPPDSLFEKSTDLYAAKPGSIVSWSGGGTSCGSVLCGHVGIIEDVKYDSNGRAVKVLLVDGYNKGKSLSTAHYDRRWMSIEKLKIYSTRYRYYFNGYVYLLG